LFIKTGAKVVYQKGIDKKTNDKISVNLRSE
jgi:hypothetical protein